MKTFYLGIHRAIWMSRPEFADVPVFISRVNFFDTRSGKYRREFPRAAGRYAIDSGGFSELQKHGRWTTTPEAYIAFLRRAWRDSGPFDFAAPMDHMCEPVVIHGGVFKGVVFAGTRQFIDPQHKLTDDELVHIHQKTTVDNYLHLRALAPDLPIKPVLQGWTIQQYLRCARMYREAGVDINNLPIVGLGSVCRRQNTEYASEIIRALRDDGIKHLHGFGFQITGIRQSHEELSTADSMSWSKDGRHAGPCKHPQHWGNTEYQPQSEANCPSYALQWRNRNIMPILDSNTSATPRAVQQLLFL